MVPDGLLDQPKACSGRVVNTTVNVGLDTVGFGALWCGRSRMQVFVVVCGMLDFFGLTFPEHRCGTSGLVSSWCGLYSIGGVYV